MRGSLLAAMVCGMAVTAVGCAHGGAAGTRPQPFPGTTSPSRSPEAATDRGLRQRIVNHALELRGARYLPGGDRPQTGFDCSGLVRFVFRGERIELPRTVAGQFATGRTVDTRNIEAGDLIFFNTTSPGPSHVGIAVDQSTFVHAPGAGGTVRAERFDTSYWKTRLAGIRRVVR